MISRNQTEIVVLWCAEVVRRIDAIEFRGDGRPNDGAATAALRRASMELTRELAKLRAYDR